MGTMALHTVQVRSVEDGFRGSWHSGTVIACENQARRVQYDHLLCDDGLQPLIDCIKVPPVIDGIVPAIRVMCNHRGLIRPLPPPIDFTKWSFHYGQCVDFWIVEVVILGSDIKTPQIGLQALARALSQRGIAKKIQVIAKARVPIVKFVEKRSGVAFDISFDLQNGPKAAEFIKNAVSKMPPLRPLCLILKVFLQQRELNEVYTGGIGSYALLAMLIAMLRSLSEQQAYPEHNLGILLMIPCMHKFEQEWPLQVSVRQIWYEVRVKKAFQNLVEWTSTLKGVWKNLVREVIFDNSRGWKLKGA
ncbi:unnamed protein product [Camellia sinensis]